MIRNVKGSPTIVHPTGLATYRKDSGSIFRCFLPTKYTIDVSLPQICSGIFQSTTVNVEFSHFFMSPRREPRIQSVLDLMAFRLYGIPVAYRALS